VNSPDRRIVRVARDVFEELEEVLGTERGPLGEPSLTDFLTIELLAIVDMFATRFDDLASLIEGRSDYRVLIVTGTLVHAIAVVGQLGADGAVEIVSIDVDLAR
jgi:hypothetical protein